VPALISVVIPHLDQASPLARCLASLARQNYSGKFEIVVVDNGSGELPRKTVARFPNARLEQEATPGPGPARNRGVACSRGEILAFTDADCTVDEGWLAAIAARLQDPQAKRILGGDVRIAVEDPKRLTELEAYESVFQYRQEEYIRKFRFSGTGNLAVRRADFDIVGPFGGIDISEDRDWGRRANALGFRIDYVPEMIVYHPARSSFTELYRKWDRHIHHDFSEVRKSRLARLRWMFYATGVFVSPAIESRRIYSSPRLFSWRSRLLAWSAVTRIRAYRTKQMLKVMAGTGNKRSDLWNR